MQLQLESTDIFADIDPRLQTLLERKSRGITTVATASTEEGEVAVIAKVNNLKEWLSMSEVYRGADLGSTPIGERKSGTSMAAPTVTGVIALMLAEAHDRNLKLTIDQIRNILAASTKKNFPQPSEVEFGSMVGDAHPTKIALLQLVQDVMDRTH